MAVFSWASSLPSLEVGAIRANLGECALSPTLRSRLCHGVLLGSAGFDQAPLVQSWRLITQKLAVSCRHPQPDQRTYRFVLPCTSGCSCRMAPPPGPRHRRIGLSGHDVIRSILSSYRPHDRCYRGMTRLSTFPVPDLRPSLCLKALTFLPDFRLCTN